MYTSQSEVSTPATSYAESTKFVADILSSMANGGVDNSSSQKMMMDYSQSSSNYPGYYCPPYPGSEYRYQHEQMDNHCRPQQYIDWQSTTANSTRNFNLNRPLPDAHHHLESQQRSHTFQLQSQQQHQQSNYSSSAVTYLPNFLVSSGTGLTPTLTPTTLATIEQSFLELQSAQQNKSWDSLTQSGFVPPVIDAGHSTEVSQDSQEYSSEYSDAEWEPKAKRGRMSDVMKDIKNVDIIVTSTGTINAAPQRKYTRRNKDEKLPPEEEEKRRIRRERNKLAAAKCRQRRVDHTNILVAETEKLEAEQSQLESEIQSLQQEKDQLEFILQAHQPLCQVDQPRPRSIKVKIESTTCTHNSHDDSCLMPENLSLSAASSASTATTTAVSSSLSAVATSESQVDISGTNSRPSSLPLIKRNHAHMLSSITGITINTPTSGMSITPSSLFCPGLDSMIDGSTGLTPLTGMSCSSQVQRNSGEGGSEAESTLISL